MQATVDKRAERFPLVVSKFDQHAEGFLGGFGVQGVEHFAHHGEAAVIAWRTAFAETVRRHDSGRGSERDDPPRTCAEWSQQIRSRPPSRYQPQNPARASETAGRDDGSRVIKAPIRRQTHCQRSHERVRRCPMAGESLDFFHIHRLQSDGDAIHLAVDFMITVHQADRTRLGAHFEHL